MENALAGRMRTGGRVRSDRGTTPRTLRPVDFLPRLWGPNLSFDTPIKT